ncbi:MAG: sensor histidine kinase [Actinobacteria bacterium]|nr:sensor histidine kinase [Actinomycetota bacterium]
MAQQNQTADATDRATLPESLDAALARIGELEAEIAANNRRGMRLAMFFLNDRLATATPDEVLKLIGAMLCEYLVEVGAAPSGADCWLRIEGHQFGILPGDVIGVSDDVAVERALAEIGSDPATAIVTDSRDRPFLVTPLALFGEPMSIYGWLGIQLAEPKPLDEPVNSAMLAIAMWVRQHLERAASVADARRGTEIARLAARAQIMMARPHELDDALRIICELLHESDDIVGVAAVKFVSGEARTVDYWGEIDPQRAEVLAHEDTIEALDGPPTAVMPVMIDGVPEASFVLCSKSGQATLADEMLATVAGAVGGAVARHRATETIEILRRSATRQLIEAQERERSMIAADVHDGVLQQLGATAIRLELAQARVERSDFEAARAIIEDGAKEIRSCARELRSLLMELRPQVLDDNGLAAALKELGRNVQDVEVEVSSSVPDDLGNEYSITIFRIVQEALTNIHKHAQAHHARVDVHLDEGAIQITITDDGVGYEAAVTGPSAEGSHLGLLGMRERADMLGGTFSIEGRSGSGTRIVAVLPIKDGESLSVDDSGQ